MRVFVPFCLCLAACGQSADDRAWPYLLNQFSYEITPAWKTPKGIAVDPTGQDVSAELVDRLTDEVETCLIKNFGQAAAIPNDVRLAGDCLDPAFTLPIDRSKLTVKVPNDAEWSCDPPEKRQMVIPLSSTLYKPSDDGCLAKGRQPTDACPCRWRAGIGKHQAIVTVPTFYVYKDPLMRLVTGCNNVWSHPLLAACAAPTVPFQ